MAYHGRENKPHMTVTGAPTMIIDMHSHIGDILYINGGDLIQKLGQKKPSENDLIAGAEDRLFRTREGGGNELNYDEIEDVIAKAARARNFTATLENMRDSMDEAGMDKTVCLPVPPYVTFNDLKTAQKSDPRIIPFTGVDYTREYDIESSLEEDVAQGAKGMKLHPIIQKVPLNSKETFKAVEAFAPHGLPILFHCGVSSYYLDAEKATNQITEYGRIGYAKDLVAAFPTVSFVMGHAGMLQVNEAIACLSDFDNVWVDITFQSPETIIELISAFGSNRVLYASDWPFGNRMVTIKTVREACQGDDSLERMIFSENATQLLKLEY